MQKEQEEALAADISELIGRHLKTVLEDGKATASELKVALDYVKHHGITDNPSRPGSHVRSVEKGVNAALPPFKAVTDEIS